MRSAAHVPQKSEATGAGTPVASGDHKPLEAQVVHQSITAAPAAQPALPVVLVSDIMLTDHYARRRAAHYQVAAAPVVAAGRGAAIFHHDRVAGYRAAETAAYGLAVLQGRAV